MLATRSVQFQQFPPQTISSVNGTGRRPAEGSDDNCTPSEKTASNGIPLIIVQIGGTTQGFLAKPASDSCHVFTLAQFEQFRLRLSRGVYRLFQLVGHQLDTVGSSCHSAGTNDHHTDIHCTRFIRRHHLVRRALSRPADDENRTAPADDSCRPKGTSAQPDGNSLNAA